MTKEASIIVALGRHTFVTVALGEGSKDLLMSSKLSVEMRPPCGTFNRDTSVVRSLDHGESKKIGAASSGGEHSSHNANNYHSLRWVYRGCRPQTRQTEILDRGDVWNLFVEAFHRFRRHILLSSHIAQKITGQFLDNCPKSVSATLGGEAGTPYILP